MVRERRVEPTTAHTVHLNLSAHATDARPEHHAAVRCFPRSWPWPALCCRPAPTLHEQVGDRAVRKDPHCHLCFVVEDGNQLVAVGKSMLSPWRPAVLLLATLACWHTPEVMAIRSPSPRPEGSFFFFHGPPGTMVIVRPIPLRLVLLLTQHAGTKRSRSRRAEAGKLDDDISRRGGTTTRLRDDVW